MAISRFSTSRVSNGLPKYQSISDNSTASTPITDTPVFYYDIGNSSSYSGSGTTLTDLSGNSRNGSFTGASYTSAGIASYLSCNGTNVQYITGTTTGVATAEITCELLVNFQDFVDGYLLAMTNAGADPEIRLSPNNRQTIGYQSYDNSQYLQIGNTHMTPKLDANTWYHIVLTVNSTTARMYVNGTLTGTVTHVNTTYSGNSSNNATETTFGTYNSPGAGYGGYTNFRLNMARWYPKVLSQEEVTRNFNSLKGRFNINGY
jgi:hypothetical protein